MTLPSLITRLREADGPSSVTEAELSAAIAAYDAACSSPVMVTCARCEGRGYHHGFGEHGYDPDWCLSCGGGGFDLADGEDTRPMREALEAAAKVRLTAWRERQG